MYILQQASAIDETDITGKSFVSRNAAPDPDSLRQTKTTPTAAHSATSFTVGLYA